MKKQQYEQIGVAMTCRSFDEYMRMFDLNEAQLAAGPILDVAAGGSSFTAQARERGYEALAADPHYGADVQRWILEAAQEIEVSTAKLDRLKDNFQWDYYGSLEQHRAGREASLARFREHLAKADNKAFYIDGRLPNLPFEENSFSLILCSHFLFLYAEQFGFEFHRQSIKELMRIAKPGGRICIYPLLSLQWEPYARLEELIGDIESSGGKAELLHSKLPFIPGSNHFLRITR